MPVARCLVVAPSPSYRHGLTAALRESGFPAEEADDAASIGPGLHGPERIVVLVVTDSNAVPPEGAQDPGVTAVALLPDASSASYTQALRRGWSAAVHRDAALSLIVEVVGEALRGRTLLPGDVARTLAGAPVGDPLSPARDAIERRRFDFAAAGIPFGDPESELTPVPGTGGCEQMFASAWLLWHPSTGAFALRRGGPIAGRYTTKGGPTGTLGYPVMDETPVGGGAICRFQSPGTAIVAHPTGEIRQTSGVLGSYWLDTLGGPGGPWGFPMSDEYDAPDGGRAMDFTGGTLVWREHSGVAEFPTRERERDVAAWLTMLPDAPVRTARGGAGRATGVRESADSGATTFVYADPALLHARLPDDPAILGICDEIDRRRELIGLVKTLRPGPEGGFVHNGTPVALSTTLPGDAVARMTGVALGESIAVGQYRQALIDLWHDLVGDSSDIAQIDTSTDLCWGAYTPDGRLQKLIRALFGRSRDARRLFLQVGMSVQKLNGRPVFVVVDTARGWRLYDRDAERYIRCDRRLLSLLIRIAAGTVPDELLQGPGDHEERNAALRQALVDAHFVTMATGVGRLPGWSLTGNWTRHLRAAVAHNLQMGCLNGWAPYRRTGGDAVEVIRALAWDFFCGPAALLAQSSERFDGPVGHGVLGAAARSFPPITADDDGEARYIVAGRQRRRVDRND